MNLSFTPVTEKLGVRVDGCDLRKPLDDATISLLRKKMHHHGLLLFRDQDLTDEQQLRFALIFGKISKQGPIQKVAPDITFVSNTRSDGTFGKGELSFHSDQCYYAHPMKAIMLYGLDVPTAGGETLFVNMAEVVESMPDALRRELSHLKVRHELDYGLLDYGSEMKKNVEPSVIAAEHPVIAKHPWSEQMVLMSNTYTARTIVGASSERSTQILRQLDELVSDPQRVYRHQWKKGDLLVWDNLLLQHARSAFDPSETRTLRRCAIGNEQEAVAA
ncbi:MAG: TauD/TfdA family dioxygenase [Burkholderiaceae bacterium]